MSGETLAPQPSDNNKPINYMDLTEDRKEYLFKLPQAIEDKIIPQLVNPKDIVMIRLIFNISVTIIPSAALLFWYRNPPVVLGVLHMFMILVLYLQRFVLTLHFASHKSLFNSHLFDLYLQYVISPFFGIPSGTYRSHHVVMHHIENNVFPYDVSSTMTYQRDNIFHFLCYWFRYVSAIWIQLPYYAWKRQRYDLSLHTVAWCSAYIVSVSTLYQFAPGATLFVFILPFIIVSFLLMFGNWCQHIFVDPERYNDSYAITYNIINSEMNKLTYNDGYHIVHHLYSQLHWSELPNYFLKNQGKFLDNRSLTFEKVEYLEIGLYVFMGWYDKLYSYYVHLEKGDQKKQSKEEFIRMIKQWLTPITPKEN